MMQFQTVLDYLCKFSLEKVAVYDILDVVSRTCSHLKCIVSLKEAADRRTEVSYSCGWKKT